jgi:SAM-dependent methyltransferase
MAAEGTGLLINGVAGAANNLHRESTRTVLPHTLEGFRNFHHDDTIVVCGCGGSLAEFVDHEQYITIGVNDVGRLFQPTYLVVLNPRKQFAGDRFDYVARSRAQALFTQLSLGIDHPHIVRFNLGVQNDVSLDTPNVLPYTRNSPYVAICLAALMGAKQIGLIGVDFTDDHFFGRTGQHPLASQLTAVDQQYQRLERALRTRGVSVVNLSIRSRLSAFPKAPLADVKEPEMGRMIDSRNCTQPGEKPPVLVTGMFGIGDNLHQRAPIRALMLTHDVWLETCHIALYHDLVAQGLKLLARPTRLRAQARTIATEQMRYAFASTRPPPHAERRKIWYNKSEVDKFGSILGAMYGGLNIPMPAAPDFRLPIPTAWQAAARRLIETWPRTSKPLMVLRQIILRKEWDGANRNPDPIAYGRLVEDIRDRFFVVSIADLAPGLEWVVGPELPADVKLHAGELDFETMAALFAEAALVVSPAGFAPVLAQAVGTPGVTVYGGRESFQTTQAAGAHLAPSLGIDPINPCDCHSNTHRCDKMLDLAAARGRLTDFVRDIDSAKPRTLIFATTYVDCEDRAQLTDLWLTLTSRLNPDCDLMLVDSASPWAEMINEKRHGPFETYAPGATGRRMLHRFADNVGHLSRGGRDGWGRAFCFGLQAAIDGGYDYVAHIEGDSLFRLPMTPIVRRMREENVGVASTPVRGMKRDMPGWVETGLMVFRTRYLLESDFIAKYDWPHRKENPTPEFVVARLIGNRIKLMPWRAWRGDRNGITHRNVLDLDLDWISHCHNDVWVYDRFVAALVPDRPDPVGTVKLNFGCGTNRIPGWQNLDDGVEIAKRLPFPDNYANFVFAEHVVEHVDYYQAIEFLRECRRVLKPGGIVRISVPSIENVMKRGDPAYFKFTTKWQPDATARGAIYALLYKHGHKAPWTDSLLEATLFFAGFTNVTRCEPGASAHPELRGVEGHHRVIGERFNWIESSIFEGECEK